MRSEFPERTAEQQAVEKAGGQVATTRVSVNPGAE